MDVRRIDLTDVINIGDSYADHLGIAQDVIKQGVEKESIILVKKAFLKYHGSHQTLNVQFSNTKNMRISFEKEHKKRFGFYVKDRQILIEMLTVRFEYVSSIEKPYQNSNN